MKYPNNIKKTPSSKVSTSKRGMNLEAIINQTNDYYLHEDIALIYKKPVPITISKISNVGSYKYISKAYFSSKSTTDYNGVYKGLYIDFDTKETTNVKYFPLSNLHIHQYEHLQRVYQNNGIGFLIIWFTKLDKIYLVFIEDFVSYVESNKSKNVPYEYIKQKGYLLNYRYNNPLDYLSVIEQHVYHKRKNMVK